MISIGPSVVLGDRYRLESRIAGGGMGEVWAARDIVLERQVAVKLLRSEYAEDPTFRTRFLAEARHAALLSHPGIAGVFDFGEADGTPYIVMELVEGETLAALLAREHALPVGQTLSIVGQAALALQAAHDAGVVHRDVKPANFIVRPDGVVKVTDFGIARALAGASVTMTGNVLGTVHYIAPEQARGERVTPASDTYALGVVAWECLEGRRPFAFDSPVAIATAHAVEPLPPLGPHVPAPVRDLIASATAKNPADRPVTAGDFGRRALALAAGLSDEPTVALHAPDVSETTVMPLLGAVDPGPDRTTFMPIMRDEGPRAAPVASPSVHRANRGGRIRLIFLLALIAAIVGVALLTHPSGNSGPTNRPTTSASRSASRSASAAATRSASPATVTLARADFLNRPYSEVVSALAAKGLTAQRRDTSNGAATDTVVDIGTGPYQRGDAVPVTVSSGPSVPADTPVPAGGGNGKGKGHDKKG